jgi:very-short-patch-repair endonuclease/DNA polymerase III delta prime subunit
LSKITDFIEQARKELLDLSGRNKLVNFRLPKAKGILLSNSAAEVFDLIKEKRLKILPLPEEEEQEKTSKSQALLNTKSEENVGLNKPKISKVKMKALETDYDSKALERRLKKTASEARSYIDERGINVLYLAIGFLSWFEDKDKEKIFKAPLALTPVSLRVSDDKKSFFMEPFEEEELDLHENTSLRTKLEYEFNIKLPQLNDDDPLFDLESYFKKVEDSISKQSGWEVDRKNNVISFFDFSKFVMYQDLTEENWINAQNPDWSDLLKVLLDPKVHFRDGAGLNLNDTDRIEDHLTPDEPTAVVDADSSQTKAIIDVREGKHLVIQGPPGTGKSQTITNIIADAFRHNKKVLFVSEKMAALEVVQKRLKQVNLGDASLEFHSHKTNKKNFYEEIGRVLQLGKPKKIEIDMSSSELSDIVKSLHGYADAINTKLSDGFSPVQIYGLYEEAKNLLGSKEISSDLIELVQKHNEDIINLDIDSYAQCLVSIETISGHLTKIGQPKKHPFYGIQIENLLSSDKKILKDNLVKAKEFFESYFEFKSIIDKETQTKKPYISLISLIEKYSSSPDISELNLNLEDWKKTNNYDEVLQRLSTVQLTKKDHENILTNSAWEMNLEDQRGILNVKGRKIKIAQFFDTELKVAKKDAQKIFKEIPEKDPLKLIEWIDRIEKVKEDVAFIKSNNDSMKLLCNNLWQGEETNLSLLQEKISFIEELIKANDELSEEIISFSKKKLDKEKLLTDKNKLSKLTDKVDEAIKKVEAVLKPGTSFTLIEGHFFDHEVGEKLLALNDNLDRSEEWITYLKLQKNLNKIPWFLEIIETWGDSSDFNLLKTFFSFATMEAKTKDFMISHKEINNFEVINQNKLVERFKELDINLQKVRQYEMLEKHYIDLSSVRSAVAGEISTIKREISKKSRKLPIRRLMENAGEALQNIKPIFMMSPLSLASYIPPRSVHFDLVIFDEASQVKSVDALGAALRADQLVVVGDSKQMPPTSFFDAQMSDEFEDDESYYDNQENISATRDIESILKLMESQNAPSRMLQWHYRSKFASLIKASNYLYYDSKLVTYPASNEEEDGNGLVFNYVKNGIYSRGDKRSNEKEAGVVAKAVLNHAIKYPELTLGVVGLSVAQKNELEYQIEDLGNKHPELSRFKDMHGPHETLFIKNLETVQGDERDVIFISIGYGKDKDGYFSNSFGPINIEGGERRLNVLISRARLRCEVFSSIKADNIKDSKARGVQDLKTFLKYAESKILDEVTETGEGYGSDFERQVQRAVAAYGYKVETQIGSAGFRLDLAVRDKENPNRFVLAIECDGAAYHSSYSARDRDRLRQEVLEARGWTFHRVWSTAWFRNPDEETKKIIDAIANAESLEKNKKKINKNLDIKFSREADLVIDFDIKKYKKPNWVKPYKSYDVNWKLSKERFYDYYGKKDLKVEIRKLVDIESPINFELIKRRVSKGVGFARAGAQVGGVIESTLQDLAKTKQLIYKNKIARSYDEKLTVRDRSKVPEAERDLIFISAIEIDEAYNKRMKGAINVDINEVIISISKDFGFSRCTEEMKMYISKAIRN